MTDATTREIAILATRAKAQLLDGVEALKCGDITLAELHFSLSLITQRQLLGALEGEESPPAKPMRKLCVVQKPREEDDLPKWMERKAGNPNDAA